MKQAEGFTASIVPVGQENDGKYNFTLSIYKEDFCKVWRYEIFFERCIENNYRIPARILKQFLDILQKPINDDLAARQALLLDIKFRVMENIRSAKYDLKFEGKPLTIFSLIQERKGNMDKCPTRVLMISEFVDSFFNHLPHSDDFKRIITMKNEFIKRAYQDMHSYFKVIEECARPTFYQHTVVVGFLAASLGLLFNEETHTSSPSAVPYYTEYLHNSTKYICKKTQKELEQALKTPPTIQF